MPEPALIPPAGEVCLRDVTASDLETFFEQQRDPQANYQAAFTHRDPGDREAFMTHWAKILADPGITLQAILYDGRLAGSVLVHAWFGKPEVSYWLGREFWGRGIATRALAAFLERVQARPLEGWVARDNLASIRVLEKCGFTRCGESREYSNARGCEVEQVIYQLK